MAARKRWRRYIPDDEISVRAFLHLIGRLFYYVGLHSEYFLLNFGRGARAAVLALCAPDGTDSDEICRIYHRRT